MYAAIKVKIISESESAKKNVRTQARYAFFLRPLR